MIEFTKKEKRNGFIHKLALNKISKTFKDFLLHLKLLPMRRKIMILSICLIGAHFFVAPVGIWLLFIYTLIEYKKQIKNSNIKFNLIYFARKSVFFIPGTIMVLGALIGSIYHGNYPYSLISIFLLAPIVYTASIIPFLWKKEDALHFARYCVMLILPVGTIAFLHILITSPNNTRLVGTFSNSNYFAYVLEIFILLALALLYHVWETKTRNRLILSALLGIFCLYMTGSRTGMVAFLLGVTIFLFSMSEKRILTIVFAFLAIILTLTAVFPEKAVEIIGDLIPRSALLTDGLGHRFELWNVALRQIDKQPFIGTGLFTYSLYVPPNAPAPICYAPHAHNILINFWLETGLAGVLAFIWILIKVTRQTSKKLSKSPIRPYLASVLAIIAVTSVHGVMDAPLISSQTIPFFAVLLSTAGIVDEPQRSKSI